MLLLGQNVFCFVLCWLACFCCSPWRANKKLTGIDRPSTWRTSRSSTPEGSGGYIICVYIYIYIFFAHVMLFLSYFIFEVCFRYVQMSYNMVWICNRLVRLKLLCKGSSDAPEVKINTPSSHFIRYTWTSPPHPAWERYQRKSIIKLGLHSHRFLTKDNDSLMMQPWRSNNKSKMSLRSIAIYASHFPFHCRFLRLLMNTPKSKFQNLDLLLNPI